MPAQHAAFFHPENVREGIGAHIEGQMADEDVFLERHVRRFIFSSANVNIGAAVFVDYGGQAAVGVNDRHVDLSGLRTN
jgi:hypothetical protein